MTTDIIQTSAIGFILEGRIGSWTKTANATGKGYTRVWSADDISSATTKQIIVIDPSGNEFTYTASFVTDGTDGLLEYKTLSANEADIATTLGLYRWVTYTTDGTDEWPTDGGTYRIVNDKVG